MALDIYSPEESGGAREFCTSCIIIVLVLVSMVIRGSGNSKLLEGWLDTTTN
jgi:hypothetical protein